MGNQQALEWLEGHIGDPREGLPEDVFLFVSGLTPLVNVDLLIRDQRRGTLLTWREDPHYGAGWHVPGGIIRFQERALDRVRAVGRLELEAEVEPEAEPLMVHETIDRRVRARGHFYSLLFRCAVRSGPAPALEAVANPPQRGQWRWHRTCPEDLLEVHRVYGKFFA